MNIKFLLENTTHPLYRGMGDPGSDISGQEVSSTQRRSKTMSNAMLNLWDNVVMPRMPQLKGTAPRSNCLIMSRDLNHAALFGVAYQMEVINHSTPFTWCAMDFNELPGMGDVSDILEMMCKKAGIPMIGDFIPELDKAVSNSWNLRRIWKNQTHQKDMLPGAWTVDFFEHAFKYNGFGVANSVDEIPEDSAEVWFQGTAKAIKRV